MARTTKIGLDYFPLDTQFEDKIKLIEAKHGLEGLAILIKLFQKIYGIKGYFIEWQTENILLFSQDINVDINRINEVINDSINWKIFNKDIYQRLGLLTSHGIQVRYKEATWRRQRVEIIEQINLLEEDEQNKNMIIVDINSKNVNINSQIGDINRVKNKQSKVKESKVKDISNYRSDSDESNPNKEIIEPEIKFDKDSMPYRAAVYLRKLILENNPRQPVPNETPGKLQDWAIALDRLNRLGPPGGKKGYEWDEIGKIMMWCQDDDFWKGNILSAGKFREKIVTLENQMNRSGGSNKHEKQDDAIMSLYQKYKEEESCEEE